MLDLAFLAIFVVSTAYLGYRAFDVAMRQLRSYTLLPFVTEDPAPVARDTPADRARAAMVGVALGDALGMPRESLPVWATRLRFGRDPKLSRGLFRALRRRGAVTDDTQLTAAVARAVRDDGSFDAARFERELAAWWPIRIGPGRATAKAVRRVMAGHDEPGDPDSQGNGAAMRVVPLAVAYSDDLQSLVDAVVAASRPTHANAEAIAGAESIARATRLLLVEQQLTVDAILPAQTSQSLDRWRDLIERARQLADTADDGLAELGTTGWVFHTIPSVLYLYWRWPDDFTTGLRAIFRAGGDVDTIAALYGALVGARHGMAVFEDLPWRDVQGVGVLCEEAARIGTP